MLLWFRAVLAAAVVVLAGNSALAEPVTQLSHRDRLYDATSVNGELYAIGHPGLLLRSRDGGKTFENVRAGQVDEALFGISFNRKGQGAIVGRSGFFLTTQDQGKTWSKGVVTLGEEKPALFSVSVLENGTIVAVGEFGYIALPFHLEGRAARQGPEGRSCVPARGRGRERER